MLVQEVLVLDVPANRKEGYNFYKINLPKLWKQVYDSWGILERTGKEK